MTVLSKGIVFRKRPHFEVLLLKRTKKEGGFWQPPGGKVEKNESIETALYRELEEETGITKTQVKSIIPKLNYFEFSAKITSKKSTSLIKEHAFGVEVKPNSKVRLELNEPEHECYGWFSVSKAINKVKWSNDVESIKKLVSLN